MRSYLLRKLEGVRAPEIDNYNQIIHYKAFERNQAYKIPERNVCILRGKADLGQVLLDPLPLFASEAKKSLDLFLGEYIYKEFIFLSPQSEQSVLYYLPFFWRTEGTINDRETGQEVKVSLKSPWPEDIPIIYLKTGWEICVLLRLDLLESLLRRGMCGVTVTPVQIQGGEQYVR